MASPFYLQISPPTSTPTSFVLQSTSHAPKSYPRLPAGYTPSILCPFGNDNPGCCMMFRKSHNSHCITPIIPSPALAYMCRVSPPTSSSTVPSSSTCRRTKKGLCPNGTKHSGHQQFLQGAKFPHLDKKLAQKMLLLPSKFFRQPAFQHKARELFQSVF
jgi:hypothetical protein